MVQEKWVNPSFSMACSNLYLDTPFTSDFSLSERDNHLRLYGGPYNLSAPACPTLFLRKQTHLVCTWQTKLLFSPGSEDTEAGTVLWWNYFTYTSLGIRKQGEKRVIRFQSSEEKIAEEEIDLTSEVILTIECGSEYRFGYRQQELAGPRWIGTISNKAATKAPPIGACFTGMMFGLYAFGERQRVLTPADFEYAQIS